MINRDDIIYFKSNKNFKDVVIEEVLKLVIERSNIKLTNNKSKSTKVVISDTIDSEANEIVNCLINKKIKSFKPVDGKIIRPLYLFSDEEVLLYTKLKGLKFKTKKTKTNDISEFLEKMEKKHPEIKRAVVNSYLKLYQN